MPIETDTRRWTYTGDGSSTQFAYDALAFEQSNLTVRVAGVLQVFSVDYSVTGLLASDGGNVVFVSAPANGAAIEIVRTVPPRQPVDLPSAGALPAEVIMRMVDRTVAALIDRFGVVVDMRPDASATLTNLLLPDPEPGALIGWDGTAGALQNLVVNDGSVLPALLGSLTTSEITQLLNINATTISAAQWGYLGGLGAPPLVPNAPATVTNLVANTVSTATATLSGLLSSTALTNATFEAARFRNTSQGAAASTRFSLGNFADPNDFSIVLNGTGNNTGPGLRGTTIRANGGAMNLEATGGLTVPSSVASDSNLNGAVTHLRLRNLNAGATAQTQLALGNDAGASDFSITLNGSNCVGGAGPRGVLVNANVGDLLLSGGGSQLRLDASGFIVSQTIYDATVPAAANVTVDSNGLLRRNTSALKYKQDIADYTRGLADLQALRPVTFKSVNADDDNTYAGFIAEEVHDAGLAEYVVYDPQGAPDALHYPHMIALAVAAIKDLAGQVAALQGEVANLESRVTALEAP